MIFTSRERCYRAHLVSYIRDFPSVITRGATLRKINIREADNIVDWRPRVIERNE